MIYHVQSHSDYPVLMYIYYVIASLVRISSGVCYSNVIALTLPLTAVPANCCVSTHISSTLFYVCILDPPLYEINK